MHLANLQKPLRILRGFKGFRKKSFLRKGFSKCFKGFRRVLKNVFLEFCLENNIIDQLSICTNSKCPKSQKNSVKIINETFTHKCKNRGCSRYWSARKEYGYKHYTVNHKENFVNPKIGNRLNSSNVCEALTKRNTESHFSHCE